MSRIPESKLEFSWKFGDFEIRTNHEEYGNPNSPIRKNCPIELIKWLKPEYGEKRSCYTVAFWYIDDEGYELRFVGGRPFSDIEPDEIAKVWGQFQAAQKMLDAYFETLDDEDF